MKKNLLIVLILWFLPTICLSQTNRLNTFIKDSLDNYIKSGISDWKIPGLSIAIIKNGELIFNKGYGIKNVNTDAPVDTNTLFMIGSLSKAITCVTTVVLSEKNSLSLDDPITKWFPEINFKKGFHNIIIEDILTGRTGLGSHKGDFLFWKTYLDYSDLIKILPNLNLEYPVRQKFIYNNISYLLTNKILSDATGKDWSEAVQTEFFAPLKMENSYTFISKIPSSKRVNLASPHLKYKSKIISIEDENIENMGPAGSVVSTSKDFSKWIQEFIIYEGTFPISVKKIIRKPYQLKGYRKKKDNSDQLRFLFSGMGWNITDEFDRLTYIHDGGTDGFKAHLMIIPEEEYGVIVLTNSRSHNFGEALVDELQYALMNQHFQNFSEEYLNDFFAHEQQELVENKKIEMLIRNNSQESISLYKYVGTYYNAMYGEISIAKTNGQLELNMLQHQNKLTGKLENIGGNKFYVTFSKPEFSSTKIEFSLENKTVYGFRYLAELTGDQNYWFLKK